MFAGALQMFFSVWYSRKFQKNYYNQKSPGNLLRSPGFSIVAEGRFELSTPRLKYPINKEV